MNRPARAILTATTLTVTLAGPAAAHAPATGHVEGIIASVNTRSNRITLTDGTVVRYRHQDRFATTHIHEQPGADPFDCDVEDHGGLGPDAPGTTEGVFEDVLAPGGQLTADVQRKRRDGPSFFYVVLNTCDGVLDGRDAAP